MPSRSSIFFTTFTMNTVLVVAFACFAASAAYVVEDVNGQEYLLVPLHRQRRQTTYDISKSQNGGVRASVHHQGTILNNGVHRLDGGAGASKQFNPSGPLSASGNLGYTHIPSGSTVNLGAEHTRGFGTNVGANANANLWRRGNSRLNAVGEYSRQFGGPGGTGRPNYYGGVQFTHRF